MKFKTNAKKFLKKEKEKKEGNKYSYCLDIRWHKQIKSYHFLIHLTVILYNGCPQNKHL